MVQLRWTSADLELLPDDGKRYEIIDGELYVSKTPTLAHQLVCSAVCAALYRWTRGSGNGIAVQGPGLVFADDDDVVPDVAWISAETLRAALGTSGHLHTAPELTVEVLSPGSVNERRDREAKLKLYSRRGVREYWIVDWQVRQLAIYRRSDLALHLDATLLESDVIESPLLPGFSLPMADLFLQLP